MNRREIAAQYFRTWFVIDLVSTFPYSWIVDGIFEEEDPNDESTQTNSPSLLRVLKLLRFMRLFKLVRLAKVSQMLVQIEDYIASSVLSTLFHFVKLLGAILYLAHWTACIWYYIAEDQSYTNHSTWIIVNSKPYNESLYEVYVGCLYWAVTTMSTVGYGDIVPITVTEKVFASFVMILACGVFAFILASVSSLVESHRLEANIFRDQVSQLHNFLKSKNIPSDMQAKAMLYLEYRWTLRKKRHDDELEFLSILSEPLRDEVNMHLVGKILYNYRFLRRLGTAFISGLTKIAKLEIFAPKDLIFSQGETGDKLYFVKTGSVDLFDSPSNTIFSVVRLKGVFGEVGFLLDTRRSLSARTCQYTEIISIDKANFEEVLERFPAVWHILEQVLKACKTGNLTDIDIRCFCCKMKGHLAIDCPELSLGVKGERKLYTGHQRKWVQSRMPKSKLLNPYSLDADFPNKKQAVSRKDLQYSYKNVVGVCRGPFMFKSASLLNAKVEAFDDYVPPAACVEDHAISEEAQVDIESIEQIHVFTSDSSEESEESLESTKPYARRTSVAHMKDSFSTSQTFSQ